MFISLIYKLGNWALPIYGYLFALMFLVQVLTFLMYRKKLRRCSQEDDICYKAMSMLCMFNIIIAILAALISIAIF
jgi:hypothetical protein